MSKKSLSAAKAAQAAATAAAPSDEIISSYEEIYLNDEMLAIIASIKVFTLKGYKRVVINYNNGRIPDWGFVEDEVPFGHMIPESCKFGKEISSSGELKLTLLEGKVIKATKGSF